MLHLGAKESYMKIPNGVVEFFNNHLTQERYRRLKATVVAEPESVTIKISYVGVITLDMSEIGQLQGRVTLLYSLIQNTKPAKLSPLLFNLIEALTLHHKENKNDFGPAAGAIFRKLVTMLNSGTLEEEQLRIVRDYNAFKALKQIPDVVYSITQDLLYIVQEFCDFPEEEEEHFKDSIKDILTTTEEEVDFEKALDIIMS